MAKPTRRLGRGLDALVSDLKPGEGRAAPSPSGQTPGPKVLAVEAQAHPSVGSLGAAGVVETKMLPPNALSPNPYQPRNNVEETDILSLARSIETSGLLQPIAVRRKGDQYEIIAGERRWRAAQHLGLDRVPVLLRDATDEQMLELALVENLQREDLNAIDRARAYRRFCTEFDLKPEEVAGRVGEDRTTVVNYLRLLDLPRAIRDMVAGGSLSMGHARCLVAVQDEVHQRRLADAVVGNDLSVRALEEIVRRERKARGPRDVPREEPLGATEANIRDLERRFEQALKTKVTIRPGRRKGTGRITIEYFSFDDFERICEVVGATET